MSKPDLPSDSAAAPPSLRTVAAAAGVHYSTVSLALREHPSIPAATRARVRAVAERLGYHPDPMLAALARYRHRRGPQAERATLAFLSPQRNLSGWWRLHHSGVGYYQGALARAEQLGFRVETFSHHRAVMSLARLFRVLTARGIKGLVVFPVIPARGHLRLPWEKFYAVTFGHSLVYPALHRVSPHHFHAAVLAIRRLRALGYRRMGLVLQADHDERVNHGWSTGYFLEAGRAMPRRGIPWLKEVTQAALGRWWRRWRPDAVVSAYPQTLEWLRAEGCRVPEDAGFACLSLPRADGSLAGIDENSADLGTAAVDLLVGVMQRLETGIPARRQTLLIEGTWIEGATVRPVRGSARP